MWLKQNTFSPESVSYSILKVDETFLIDAEQVTRVEVGVSFLVDIMQLLLLGLLQVSCVTSERRFRRYFTHQESRLTFGKVTDALEHKCNSYFRKR